MKKFEMKLSDNKQTMIETIPVILTAIKTLGEVGKSYIDLQKEREKTNRTAIESDVKLEESRMKFFTDLGKLKNEALEIQTKYNIKMKELDNEMETRKMGYMLLTRIIEQLEKTEHELKLYQREYGLKDEAVFRLLDQLHNQRLSLVKQIPALRG